MLAEYLKEKDSAETIVTDGGFLAYLIRHDQLFISDFYVKPDFRKSKKHFLALMREAFKVACDNKLNFFTCRVLKGQRNFDERLLAYLKFGFKVSETKESHIGLFLELKECSWAAVAETQS